MKNKKNAIALLILISVFSIQSLVAQDIPSPSGYFTDTTNTFSNIETQLENFSLNMKEKTGCEMGILVVNSLQGYTVEEFAFQAFNQWGIGEKEKDNGILFLLAIHDRKARLEVGYGLEYLLTDAKAGSLLMDYAVPYFRNDEWAEGLLSTTQAVTHYIISNYNPEEQPDTAFTGTTHIDESKELITTQTREPIDIEDSLNLFIENGFCFLILIAVFIFNLVLHFMRKFLRIPFLIAEIAVCILLFVISFAVIKDDDFRLLNIILFIVAGIVYIIQYFNSINHKCPKCGKYLTITSHTITSATYTSSGRGRRDYNCPFCKYHKSQYYTIPRRTRSSSSSSGYSSGGGYSSSSYSSSSSFGGGSSGGGGASVGF